MCVRYVYTYAVCVLSVFTQTLFLRFFAWTFELFRQYVFYFHFIASLRIRVRTNVMVFNATFNNIPAMLWRSVSGPVLGGSGPNAVLCNTCNVLLCVREQTKSR